MFFILNLFLMYGDSMTKTIFIHTRCPSIYKPVLDEINEIKNNNITTSCRGDGSVVGNLMRRSRSHLESRCSSYIIE